MSEADLTTMELDVPALSGAFAARLQEAGVPVSAERATAFAEALVLVAPIARRRLYWTARSVFVSSPAHARAFDEVFAAVFGSALPARETEAPEGSRATAATPADARRSRERGAGQAAVEPGPGSSAASSPGRREAEHEPVGEQPVPMLASDEEVLRSKRFDDLDAAELAELYKLMARLRIATPLRSTRRARRAHRGERVDLRHTLRRSMRNGGDPVRLSRRRRRVVPRRMVLLCDISGSMEPYARAYLQFLTCATGSAAVGGRLGANRSEAFVFATRLTRVTRALATRNPVRAIERAAEAAPDWSSGTRIGTALKTFNDTHGRRGMARGAVVVVLSDGWERGDPELVGREMSRLRRLAHRIVWVNPRAAADGFVPVAGGMLAALPYCDALVSGQSLEALGEVVEVIGCSDQAVSARGGAWQAEPAAGPPGEDETDEAWASATPVAGSSVAMPSGWSPSRGKTTPGWGLG